jgi:3-oxoacyl-[acyl-carrier protein] reductase
MKLEHNITLITGASKGIGRAIALRFAMEGASIIAAARTPNDLDTLSDEIQRLGRPCLAVPCDVGNERQVEHLVKKTLDTFGGIDILVNNAGVGVFAKVVESRIEDFGRLFNTNVRGTYLCSRAVLPSMIQQKSGCIINIASLAGKNSFIGGAMYSATKFAMRGFAQSLMLEVREYNIRVLTICPGSVDTNFSDKGDRGVNVAKILRPEDVAETVLFAATMPAYAMVSEIDLRPTNPK